MYHARQYTITGRYNIIWVGTKPGLWTLDWAVDWTMNWIMDLILVSFCHLKKTMNAGFPNKQVIGITVGTDIYTAFSKMGWWF